MREIKLKEFSVPIVESARIDGEFLINGIAINETTTSNGHKFIADELRPAAQNMVGIPLLKDHVNSVDNIMGRVRDARFDELDKNIPFKAQVNDVKAQELIKRGDLNSVSIGCTVSDLEETDDGSLIARGIQIKELSLVAVPADGGATFGLSLSEAWESKNSDSLSEDNNNIIEKGGEDRVTEEETKTSEEPKEEPKKEENVEAKLLKKELVEANKKLAEFAAKERAILEKEYSALCESKKVKSLDVSTMDNSVLEMLKAQVEAMADVDEIKEPEEPKKEAKEEPKEDSEDDSEEDVEEKLSFEEGEGSLGGKRLTLIRNY